MGLYQWWCSKKADVKTKRLHKFYTKGESILDIGSGNCALNMQLKNLGFDITGLDIRNKSAYKEIEPVIYDGSTLPFEDNSFDIVQLITVLHHIKDPEKILREAKRVGRKVIVMEDIYESGFQKRVTFIADSINNWEFRGHPHTNKTDREWLKTFEKYDLKVQEKEYYKFLLFFKQSTYILNKE
jgi:SAM-dependent methyltransferase